MTYLARLADRVLNRPLALEPGKLAVLVDVLGGRLGIEGLDLKPEARAPTSAAAGRRTFRLVDGVAIIPVVGSLVARSGYLDAESGLTSYEVIKVTLSQAVEDPDVNEIVLDIDSGGGEAIGCIEAAEAVRAAAAKKPVAAVCNGMTASAAYAIASAATTIVATPSSLIGSIGVVLLHVDRSRAMDAIGLRPTLIHAGARKVDGNAYEPLTDEVTAELQADVDSFYDLFVDTVAKGRKGLTRDAIRATEARTYLGARAVAMGLADRVATFEDVLDAAAEPLRARRREQRRAEDEKLRLAEEKRLAAKAADDARQQAAIDAQIRRNEERIAYFRAHGLV